jgi:hypothetical protein
MSRPKNKSKRNKKSKENMLLVSSNLKYKDYYVTPGKRVNVISGMYLEYTILDAKLNRKDSTDKSEWCLSLVGPDNDKLVSLDNLEWFRENPFEAAEVLEPYLNYRLSGDSCVVRVDLHKWGGSGIDHQSIDGWKDHNSYPLFVRDVFGWFTGISEDYPKILSNKNVGIPDPRFVELNPSSKKYELSVYNGLYQDANLVVDPSDRMAMIAGVEFFSGRDKDRRFSAPSFIFHALPDYSSEFGLNYEGVSDYLMKKCRNIRPGVRSNMNVGIPRASEISKLLFKDGKLLRPAARKYLSPQIHWIPGTKLEALDNPALRMCSDIMRTSNV